jgi:hexokinase
MVRIQSRAETLAGAMQDLTAALKRLFDASTAVEAVEKDTSLDGISRRIRSYIGPLHADLLCVQSEIHRHICVTPEPTQVTVSNTFSTPVHPDPMNIGELIQQSKVQSLRERIKKAEAIMQSGSISKIQKQKIEKSIQSLRGHLSRLGETTELELKPQAGKGSRWTSQAPTTNI